MIESTILIEERAEADRVMISGRDGGYPDNVTQCFTMKLFRVGDRAGGASSLTMNTYKGPPRLNKDIDKELREKEAKAQGIKLDIVDCIEQYKRHTLEQERLESERKRDKMLLTNLEKDIKMKSRAVEDLQENLQEDEPTNLHAYEESKQAAQEQIEAMKKQYEPVAQRKHAIAESMEPIKEQIAQIDVLIKKQENGALKLRVCTTTN